MLFLRAEDNQVYLIMVLILFLSFSTDKRLFYLIDFDSVFKGTDEV